MVRGFFCSLSSEVKPPRLYQFGKVVPVTPTPGHHAAPLGPSGKFLVLDGVVKKAGLPTSVGHRFIGECDGDGVRQGLGIETVGSHYRFAGMFQGGKRSGTGCLHHSDRVELRGTYVADKLNGDGEIWIKDRLRAKAEFAPRHLIFSHV